MLENLVKNESVVNNVKVVKGWPSETVLYNIVQSLFPSKSVVFRYRGLELHGLELDVWLPELKLGIEYQGIQHYKPMKHWGGAHGFKKRKKNDEIKKELCAFLGYTLVEIPYTESLDSENIALLLRPYLP